MPVDPEPEVGLFIRDDDEGLFSRNLDGQLVRLDAPTDADYGQQITLQIDGQPVTVPLAEPLTDANGNVVLDTAGRTTPRFTTIYDAATRLYVRGPGDEAKIPIPTLCHQPHMTPVAVCRLCVVQIAVEKRGKLQKERKLLPACQHPVKPGMEVFTMQSPGRDGDRVRQAVKVMTELLAADHLKPAPAPAPAAELAPFNELGRMVERCGADASRFDLDVFSPPAPVEKPCDATSPVFLVDHSACILCDRCIRACAEVKGNDVIGRTGKGASAAIGFDLAAPMGESSCVQCGECMVSCPTSAITFKPIAQVKIRNGHGAPGDVLSAAELAADPFFAGVPPKFLLWQQGLARRRQVEPGDVLCRQGEPGNTAWLIRSGRFEVTVHPPPQAARGAAVSPLVRRERTAEDVIVGEMSCISVSPRSADVVALETGEVWEIRRNLLDRLMRVPSQQERFGEMYRRRALDVILRSSELFSELAPDEYGAIVELLRPALRFVRARRGQEIIRQGDAADQLFLIRLGSVRISIERFGKVSRVATRGPGTILGEIGLLALAASERDHSAEEVDAWMKSILDAAGDDLTNAIPAGQRTATVTALDHMELATIGRAELLEIVRRFPGLRRRLVETSLTRLRSDREMNPFMHEYVEQELYEGRSLLVLDLDRCTRCDECTRGCIEQHGTESHGAPTTRMLRDGRRFGQFVVATACRSCKDPDCISGCPVDAIHRGRHHQIVIEDHCIGCGLCAQNCPYGSIFMEPDERRTVEMPDPLGTGSVFAAQLKASTCDLCDSAGTRDTPKPRCVYACPHEAAFRMTGEELLARVLGAAAK